MPLGLWLVGFGVHVAAGRPSWGWGRGCVPGLSSCRPCVPVLSLLPMKQLEGGEGAFPGSTGRGAETTLDRVVGLARRGSGEKDAVMGQTCVLRGGLELPAWAESCSWKRGSQGVSGCAKEPGEWDPGGGK